MILLTLPTRSGVSPVLRETSAISSGILINRLPFNDPSARASRATTVVMVVSCDPVTIRLCLLIL